MITAQEKATLIYVGDPMCSWCYGFTNELDEAVGELSNEVNFELIMGGLRPYNDESMYDLKNFLVDHWEEVHARTGQKFSYDILEQKEMMYDTEPACRAVVTLKSIEPSLVHTYFKSTQHSFYFQNKNPLSSETYSELAQKLGIDKDTFESKFNSEEMKQAVKDEFSYAAQLGATSFPTLILKQGENYYLVSRGYSKSEVIVKSIRKILGVKT